MLKALSLLMGWPTSFTLASKKEHPAFLADVKEKKRLDSHFKICLPAMKLTAHMTDVVLKAYCVYCAMPFVPCACALRARYACVRACVRACIHVWMRVC